MLEVGVKSMIELMSKVTGVEDVNETLDGMPPLFRGAVKHWIFSERKRYYDKFKKSIARQKHNAGAPSMFRSGGTWKPQVAGPFHKISLDESGNTQSAEIGLQDGGNKPVSPGFRRRLAMMEETTGGSDMVSSGKYMTIPLVKNLAKNSAAQRDLGGLALNRRTGARWLRNLISSHSITAIKKNGTMYYFDNDMEKRGGGFKKAALLFIGKKAVKLRKRINFIRGYEERKDAAVDNFVTKINRLLRNVSRGYMSSE